MTKDIKVKIGDTITFRVVTNYGTHKATRKVTGICTSGKPLVKFHGWDDYQIRWNEIIEVKKK
tara:strand:+ start:547 stop:735 length:189 start_codon:yes stop_codon:yes gene_type:complete